MAFVPPFPSYPYVRRVPGLSVRTEIGNLQHFHFSALDPVKCQSEVENKKQQFHSALYFNYVVFYNMIFYSQIIFYIWSKFEQMLSFTFLTKRRH